MTDLSSNASLPPVERESRNGGPLDRTDLIKALERVQWTTEMKDGRVPTVCQDGQKLGHWKAEEFSKFVQVAPAILHGLIPRKAFKCFCLLTELNALVFSINSYTIIYFFIIDKSPDQWQSLNNSCGRNQAERVARALDIMPERPPIKKIVSSTMVRAQQTAAIIGTKPAMEFLSDEALEEGTPD